MRLSVFFLILSIHPVLAQTPAYKDTVFTEYFRRTSGWTASDATISVPLSSGYSLWLMGDSFIDNYQEADTTLPCLFQVRNSILYQPIHHPNDITTVLDYSAEGVNRTPVKLKSNDTTYFWPGSGYAKGDTAVLFWQRYSGSDYHHVGNYVVKLYTTGLQDASSIASVDALPVIPEEYEFGTSVIVDSTSGYNYFYGSKKDWIIFRPYVARLPLDADVKEPWEFFNGTSWGADPESSAQLMSSTDEYVSISYSVIKLQNKYYLISQEIGFLTCGLGREIYSWESDNPEGPFTNKKLLYTIEDKYRGEYMITYNAQAHPEFIHNNELLISYNVNGTCTSYCQNAFTDRWNADLYRPKFIRVPLDYIDPDLHVEDPDFPDPYAITGMENNSHGMNIYPNPSDGRIRIVPEKSGSGRVVIKNSLGQVIFSKDQIISGISIHLPHRGIYYVLVYENNKNVIARKLIVE